MENITVMLVFAGIFAGIFAAALCGRKEHTPRNLTEQDAQILGVTELLRNTWDNN